jgi:steroid delta-isomerase-like uncharacterized protein
MNSGIVDKFFDNMQNGDIDGALSLLHEDHVGHDMGTGAVMKGIEENRADMENWTTTFSDMKIEVLNHIESGNTVVSELKMTGVNTGDLEQPDGSKIPATGKSVEMNACQVAEFENGKMIKSTQYYNMMTMMAQLGLMPE